MENQSNANEYEQKVAVATGSSSTIDAAWLDKKSTMTDEQFQRYIRNSMASVAPSQRS